MTELKHTIAVGLQADKSLKRCVGEASSFSAPALTSSQQRTQGRHIGLGVRSSKELFIGGVCVYLLNQS